MAERPTATSPAAPAAAARPAAEPHAVALPAVLAGRYRIGAVIGSGGMATVHAAEDVLLKRRVAVKVFRARAEQPETLRAQEAEAKLIASLNHPALTTLFDAGVDTTDPHRPQIYLVMEYLAGRDLRERLRQGPLDPVQVSGLGRDLAEALGVVHAAGFLHRDVKPANVLLTDAETRLRGKLTDFGIASLVGSTSGSTDAVIGTAAYISPEQVARAEVGGAADVYSLGLVLLEAATGVVAFPGAVVASALARLDRSPDVPATLPDGLAATLRAMTARDPADRPTPEEAASRFQDVLIDDAVRRRSAGAPQSVKVETARSAVVQRYDVLDTPAEHAFEHVTRLAARLLDVPIALLSIVDVDRVWFKSRRGFDAEQLSRDVAFCTATDPGTGPWALTDARADERTRDNPLVTGAPHVRAHAAAPLVTRDGHRLGALEVYDTEPHEFRAEDLSDLADLAEVVMRELELRLATKRSLLGG